jgi:hypothetical protein
VTFLYGCGATFAGVFIIAWEGHDHGDDNDDVGDNITSADGEAGEDGRNIQRDETFQGSFSRRRRALPKDTLGLRNKHSAVGLVGLSPSQVLSFLKTLFW